MMNARRASDADVAIGERIRARRNQIQISQDELGQALGVSFQQIQKYEKGVNRLSSGRLVELAATLQCSAADLIGGVEKASAKSTPFSRYAASKEGVAIINAMSKSQAQHSAGTSSTSLNASLTLSGTASGAEHKD